MHSGFRSTTIKPRAASMANSSTTDGAPLLHCDDDVADRRGVRAAARNAGVFPKLRRLMRTRSVSSTAATVCSSEAAASRAPIPFRVLRTGLGTLVVKLTRQLPHHCGGVLLAVVRLPVAAS